MILGNNKAEEIFGKAIEQLVHDLRNSLNTVIGFSSLLKEEKSLSDEHKNLLNKIFISGSDMEEFLLDIDYYMLDNNDYFSQKKEIFDPMLFVKEFFDSKKELLKELKIDLYLFTNGKCEINFQKEILSKILNNLLKTSIKGIRSQTKKEIYLYVKLMGKELLITYTDSSTPIFIQNDYFNLEEALQSRRGLGLLFLEKYTLFVSGKIYYLYGNNWINFISTITTKIKNNHGFKILLPV